MDKLGERIVADQERIVFLRRRAEELRRERNAVLTEADELERNLENARRAQTV